MKKDLTIIGKLVHPYLRLLFTIFCFSSFILIDSAAAAARQAGIKVVIGSSFSNSQGYTLLECDVVEIHPDNEVSMIADWQSLQIREPGELIESMGSALKESSPQDPLVIIINAGILYNQLGTENAKRYTDNLVFALNEMKRKEKLEFITSAEFYREFIGGKQYIVLRIDGYQKPFMKNFLKYARKAIEDIHSRILEKLKIKSENN